MSGRWWIPAILIAMVIVSVLNYMVVLFNETHKALIMEAIQRGEENQERLETKFSKRYQNIATRQLVLEERLVVSERKIKLLEKGLDVMENVRDEVKDLEYKLLELERDDTQQDRKNAEDIPEEPELYVPSRRSPVPRIPALKPHFEFIFVWSTGQGLGTNLSAIFAQEDAFVTYEREPCGNTRECLMKVYKKIVRPNDQNLAQYYVENEKIPFMVQDLITNKKTKYLDGGNQILMGFFPALIQQLHTHTNTEGSRLRVIRLRRDRILCARDMALQQDTAPCDLSAELGNKPLLLSLCPRFGTALLVPSDEGWRKMNHYQKYLWYVDEVELQWQHLIRIYNLDYLEIDYKNKLDKIHLDIIANWTKIRYSRETEYKLEDKVKKPAVSQITQQKESASGLSPGGGGGSVMEEKRVLSGMTIEALRAMDMVYRKLLPLNNKVLEHVWHVADAA